MYSKKEMQMLQKLSKGEQDISELSESMEISTSQVYKIAGALKEKNAVHLDNGKIVPERHTYLSLLLNTLHDYGAAAESLSGQGMDILSKLLVPRTVTEVSKDLGLDRRTVDTKIKKLEQHGMVKKTASKYTINDPFWPDLRELVEEYERYSRIVDTRIPSDSRVYFRSADLVVFSNDREMEYTRTAFSCYGSYGIRILLNTNYYCNLRHSLAVQDIMLHSMQIISADKDWRLRMMALIFYKKHRNEMEDIKHPMKDEMEKVLNTKQGKVEGWVPLKEMQERAEMYGVDLLDN